METFCSDMALSLSAELQGCAAFLWGLPSCVVSVDQEKSACFIFRTAVCMSVHEVWSPSSDQMRHLQPLSHLGLDSGRSFWSFSVRGLLCFCCGSRRRRTGMTWRRWSWTTRGSCSTCCRLMWLSTSSCQTPGIWWASGSEPRLVSLVSSNKTLFYLIHMKTLKALS